MDFRPHTLNWTTLQGESTEDPETGYMIPGAPGVAISVPCRFRLGGIKVFKNQDNSETKQIGTIRVDMGSDMPLVDQDVTVTSENGELFSGAIKTVYKGGQLISWRMDV